METEWLDPGERVAWIRLVALVELLPGVLDSQLRRDARLTYFDYFVMAMLSEAPDHVLQMTALADRTNATLARLSHVVSRLESRGLVERVPCPGDRRATNVRLTEEGWEKVVATAPGHVTTVRRQVFDALDPDQVPQLAEIARSILLKIDPESRMTRHALGDGKRPAHR